MKNKQLIIIAVLLLIVSSSQAQFGGGVQIGGPTSVDLNSTHTYWRFATGTVYSANWSANGGQIISSDIFSCQVKWTSTGSRSVSGWFNTSNGSYYDSHPVTVNQAAPSPPSAPYISSSNTCGSKTISRHSPPSGTVWYWQGTNSSGTSTSNSSTSYSVSSTGTYYLRARKNGIWSTTSSSVHVTIYSNLSAGSINGTQTICYGGNPSNLSNASSAGGCTGTLSYQWQYSNNGSSGWTNISGATGSSYDPPGGLTSSRWYRRRATRGGQTVYTASRKVTVYGNLSAGSINGTQTICYSGDPGTLGNASSPSGGNGSYSYQWQYSSNNSSFSNISGATGSTYNPPGGLTANRWYRRRVISCGQTKYTGSIKVTVNGNLNAGSISGTQTICYSGDPSTLGNASSPSGGNGSYSYQWQYSSNNSSFSNISGATSSTYNPPGGLTANRWYRRRVISCGQTKYTGSIKVTVYGNLNAGSINGTQTICYNGDPATLGNASTPSGGNGSYSYQWQYSSNNSSFSNISGATASTYNPPGGLTADRWYRRRVISCGQTKYTGSIKVTVYGSLNAGSINGTQTICYNGDPGTIGNASSPSGSNGSYSYQWQYSNNNSSFSNISGATSSTYNPPAGLTADRWYRRRVQSCGETKYTGSIKVTVRATLSPGGIYGTQTICYNGNPSGLGSAISASGGDGNYSYQWQYSNNNSSFSNISGATSTIYDPPAGLTADRWYRRRAQSCGETKYTTSIKVTVHPSLNAGSINGTQTICYNGDPGTLGNASSPTQGDGSYSYQWQYSNNNSSFSNISGANSNTYNPPSGLTADRWYRRRVQSCGETKYTASIKVTVRASLNAGSINGAQTICYNGNPSALGSATGSSGGDGNYVYQWEQRTPGGTWSAASGSNTNESYDPSALNTTMEYRRQVSSCGQTFTTNAVVVTVNPALVAGVIGTDETICVNGDAAAITSSTSASGGDGGYTYQWEQRAPGGSWVNATGVNTSESYDPGILTTTTEYRRQDNSCTATAATNIVVVTVLPGGATPVIADVAYDFSGASLQLDNAPTGDMRYWQTSPTGTSESNSDNPYQISAPGTYYVRAKASNNCWGDAASFELQATEPTAVAVASVSSEELLVSWTASTNSETGFVISRSTDYNGPYETIHTAASSDTQYLDDYLSSGTTYFYRVQALQAGQTSTGVTIKQATTNDVFIGDETLVHKPAYNGNISAIRWKNAVDQEEQAYAFDYDAMNRLTGAYYAAHILGNFSKDQGFLSVPDIDYDLNGNILNLKRQGMNNANSADIIDELTYTYKGNRLQTVDDLRSQEGFKDGADLSEEYFYDDNGNMIEDKNKGITSIEYNHLNLPEKVVMGEETAGNYILYEYDAVGTKLKQTVFEDDVPTKVTDYVGELIFETLPQEDNVRKLQLIQHDEGRIIENSNNSTFDYQYHLKDHLGNTRVTFTSTDYQSEYLATFEEGANNATRLQEQADFFNLNDADIQNYPPPPSGDLAVALANGNPIGPGLSFSVAPMDVISLSVTTYFRGSDTFADDALGGAALAGAVASAFGGLDGAGATESQQFIYDLFNNNPDPAVAGALVTGRDPSTDKPEGYINYLLFDDDWNFVDGGFFYTNSTADMEATIEAQNLVITQTGTIFIYLSNESDSPNPMFFDNFSVVVDESPVLETTDYYPFGLAFNEHTKPGTVDQNFKYNGKEEITDLGVNWSDYGARMYMADIGRWGVIDPQADRFLDLSPFNYAFNNPIFFIDPDGESPISIFAKMVAKKGMKIAAKNFVERQIKQRLKQYTSKAWGKQLFNDALDFVDHTTKTQWWEWAIEVIPVAGDAYGAAKLGEQGYRLWKGLEKFEQVAELGAKAASNAWKKVGTTSNTPILGKSQELLNKYTKKFNDQGTHLDPDDLGGAVKEKFGLGSNGQHRKEATEALTGMKTQMGNLMEDIADGKFKKGAALEAAVDLYNQVQNQYKKIKKSMTEVDNAVQGLETIYK